MSIITIQSRLVASEETLRYLWELMVQKNTPLVNELLEQLGKHPDFQTWLEKGQIPANTIKNICNSLKTEPQFAGQPGRFYTSAVSLVEYIYKSWLALQRLRQRKIEGKERWLTILKTDTELEQASNSSLEVIRAKAAEILNKISAQLSETPNQKNKPKTFMETLHFIWLVLEMIISKLSSF